jgi:pimeloyl-ACP methyl ester carboxylesterase
MNLDRTAPETADSGRLQVPENCISRRDTLALDATSRRQAKLIKNVKFVELRGASHGLTWTRAEEVNAQLVPFLA